MRWLHRTIGIALGAWLMLMGFSGALLVFYQNLDSNLHRQQMRSAGVSDRPDIDAMARKVASLHPDRTLLLFERYGLRDDESYPFVLSSPLRAPTAGPPYFADAARRPALEVFVDPQTLAILGERDYWNALRLLRSFHMELWFPENGERIVGVLGAILLLTAIAGVVLWWRESKRRLGAALKPRLRSRTSIVLRDIHTVGGIYFALFIAVQGLSGALVADFYQVTNLLGSLFGGPAMFAPPPPTPPSPAVPNNLRGISANTARDVALSHHPDSRVVQVVFPAPGFANYSVRLFPRDQPKTRYMRQYVIDPASGHIVFEFGPDGRSFAKSLLGSWMIWIHNGQFFGLLGQIWLVGTGLMLTMMFPTGLYLWLRKRKA